MMDLLAVRLLKLNATIVFTWALMAVLIWPPRWSRAALAAGRERSRSQDLLEIIVTAIIGQIEDVGLKEPRRYLGFLGTLFLFVAASALATVVPGFEPPTASLSTTAALALCVLVAVRCSASRAGAGQLPEVVSAADADHAAVQSDQRGLAHAGAGRAPVRQHDERRDDHRHPAVDHAFRLSRS